MSSAKATPGLSAFEQGAGRVDVAAAVEATVSTSPVSLGLGTFQWPHNDDVPVARTITYTNAGAAPVTLDLAAEVTAPDGSAAAAGMFTVSPAQVTIPAGGTADVTLTADTRVDGADGAYSGAVVATSGDTSVRTPVALHREVESYDLRLNVVDHNGNPTWAYGFRLLELVNPKMYLAYDPSGTAVVPADLTKRVLNRHLAKVIATHAVATPGRLGIRDSVVTMPLPFTLTEYYSPGTEWTPNFQERVVGNDFSPDGMSSFVFTPRTYQLGKTYHERWNTGVFGPGLAYSPSPDEQGKYFARLGDEFRAAVGLFGDGNADSEGMFAEMGGSYPPGTTQLVRDGQVVHEEPSPGTVMPGITLPPEEATYTLRTTATTSGRLSTRIDAEWTFRSGHVTGPAPKPVPALAVRLAPNLDDHNAAPAGKRFRIPIHVQRNGVEEPGQVNPPTVEISYDDGQTWQRATLTNRNGQWQADVYHPRGAQFASLRWSVSDDDGNSAKATIIRAYALK